jgi:flagellar motor protein MotB
MARRARPTEEEEGAPAWIVSFSDMVTLLLAFFVLLQSFAKVQDPELFFVGQGSFKQAIAGLGVPSWLFGRKDKPRMQSPKVKHPVDEDPKGQPSSTVLDAEDEKIRKAFDDLQKELETTAVDLAQETVRVEATPIRFDADATSLGEDARRYLRQFVLEARQAVRAEFVRLEVVGLAADVSDPRLQWSLSARRARAAERYLDQLLRAVPGRRRWRTCSWGAGPGDRWCRRHGIPIAETTIVIVVVKENHGNG